MSLTNHAIIPFSEPPYLSGLPSPYYSESHLRWQKTCRAFFEENLTKHALEWERAGTVPEHVFKKFAESNFLIPNLPAPLPVAWLKKLGIHEMPGGIKVEDWDYLHTLIYIDEVLDLSLYARPDLFILFHDLIHLCLLQIGRSGLIGPSGSITVGMAYGVPPILKFGSQQLQERFIPDLLTGRKRACIAITEPDAGSDVANIVTSAVKTKDGKHYIVNGTKKWYIVLLTTHIRFLSDCGKLGLRMVSGPNIPLWQSGQGGQALVVYRC
jgi:acyl-CoA dehydrogenase